MKEVIIYTDGACSGNPGPGGWAALLRYGEHVKEMSGFQPHTTNNRMEVFAAIQALGALKQPCSVTLCSDSAYLVNAFERGWLANWQRNGWKNASKQPVENQDLWQILLMTIRKHGHQVKFRKVPGHADDADNNRCDELARAASKEAVENAAKAEEMKNAIMEAIKREG